MKIDRRILFIVALILAIVSLFWNPAPLLVIAVILICVGLLV